jgi:hypothetical protein
MLPRTCFLRLTPTVAILLAAVASVRGQVRDSGIDPSNLGKGEWVYSISDATNKVGGRYPSVTNENSLMLFYQSQGIRYFVVKAGTGSSLFNGCYGFPQFTSNLVNKAHANGILVFGYNRSYATNVAGELAIVDYVFNHGADGFVWDAEAEWESSTIGSQGPALAWQQLSAARTNWPNKFFAHAPFPIIYLHSSFPYKEFGFWCDAVMPQIYHFSATKGSQSAAINWSDINWKAWQGSLVSLAPTNINGISVTWTEAIKPLAPINDVYGPYGSSPCEGTTSPYPDKHVMEFMDYLIADPMPQTVGGYKGVSFWRTDLHGTNQWSNIHAGTSGTFTGIVTQIVIDDPNATKSGSWNSVFTWRNTTTAATFVGGGSGTETNSFGTNYTFKSKGDGSAYVEFTPVIPAAGSYQIYEWHPSLTNASAAVPFEVYTNGGSRIVTANQQINAGDWNSLGTFVFSAGPATIRLRDNLPEADRIAVADGLKLVLRSAVTEPPPASPSGLTAKAVSESRIDLTWVDNSTNENGFVIGRAELPGGVYSDLPPVPANTTYYSDTGLSPNKTYWYVVRAFNAGGASTNSDPASADTLAIPPTITVQPQNASALFGQPASLSVSVAGSVPLFYQWQFNSNSIPGATGPSLTIAPAGFGDVGWYSVVASNRGGTVVSSNAFLNVAVIAGSGNNTFGQLQAPALATNAIAIAAGGWHSLALLPDGRVVGWGNDYNGQCTPPESLTSIVAITAGGYHSLAIRENGSVAAWGADDYGQLMPPLPLTNVLAIAAGTWHSLAMLENGSVLAWGDNSSGQTDVPAGLNDAVAIAAGGNHSLAVRSDGTVIGWGDNTDANGAFAGESVVPDDLGSAVGIAAGSFHSVALLSGTDVGGWGDNSSGQCTPPPIAGVVTVAAGGEFNLVLSQQGVVTGWGENSQGQYDLPPLGDFVAIAAGRRHSLALFGNGAFQPRLFNAKRNGSRFQARVQTRVRKSYALEFKNSLADMNWRALGTNRGNGALLLLVDTNAATAQRFYRVREW